MPFERLASFPNSRIKTRAPTREADTPPVDLSGVQANVPFLIIGARADRTRLTIQNKTTLSLSYGYSDSDTTAPINMNASLNSGSAIDTDTLQAVWGKFTSVPTGTIELDQGIG